MQQNKDRFLHMPEVFDVMAPYCVPCYDFLQESIFDIIDFDTAKSFVFVDLGAGSGIQIEKALLRYPNSRAVYIDSSPPFLQLAEKRLNRFKDRVQFINDTIESDWPSSLRNKPDLVFSMSAIHHLKPAEKKRVYRQVHDCLKKNGWFFNIDEMKSPHADAYMSSLLFWVRHVQKAAALIPDKLQEYYREWNRHFNGWKRRNIVDIGTPKVKGDDIHETYTIQLGYLKSAGFRNIDLFIKYHLWCVIGGRK